VLRIISVLLLKVNVLWITILLIIVAGTAYAFDNPEGQDLADPAQESFRDESNNLYNGSYGGERLDIQTGELKYVVRDVHIPGPNGMDIEVVRSYSSWGSLGTDMFHNSFGSSVYTWHIETPRMLVYATPDDNNNSDMRTNKCFNINADNIGLSINGTVYGKSIGYNSLTELPDELENDTDLMIFEGNVILDCNPGETPKVYLPNGKVIEFGFNIVKNWPQLSMQGSIERTAYFASKIYDNFGNEITYNYSAESPEWPYFQLETIVRNDGAVVNFEYSPTYQQISKITFGGKEVNYEYDLVEDVLAVSYENTDKLADYVRLIAVVDPEGRRTEYTWYGYPQREFHEPDGGVPDPVRSHVSDAIISSAGDTLGTVKLPSGLKISYEYWGIYSNLGGDVSSCWSVGGYLCHPSMTRSVIRRVLHGEGTQKTEKRYGRYFSPTGIFSVRELEVANYGVDLGEEVAYRTTYYEFQRVLNTAENYTSGEFSLDGRLIRKYILDSSDNILYDKAYDWEYFKLKFRGLKIAINSIQVIENHKK